MYFVEIANNLITAKGEGAFKLSEQIEVTEEIYNSLVNLPAEYTLIDGEIVDVYPLPIPIIQPTPKELREKEYETNPLIEWEGESITVDNANLVYLQYSAEGSTKAAEIQALIVAAKETIRAMYPDKEQG